MMGDDGEKFGGVADDLGALLGRGPLGRAVLRGARGERRLADDRPRRRPGWPTHPPIGRVYVPTGSYAEMGEWALPADESLRFTEVLAPRRRPSADPRRAGCAARSGATSRSSTARSTTSTSRCSGPPTRSAAMPAGPDARARARPPLPGPVQRLLLARPVRRDLHRPHAARDATSTSSPPRTWPRPRRARCAAPRCVDLDLDGVDEVRLADSRPGRRRSTSPRARASAAGTSGRSATRWPR